MMLTRTLARLSRIVHQRRSSANYYAPCGIQSGSIVAQARVNFSTTTSLKKEVPIDDYVDIKISTQDDVTHVEGVLVEPSRHKLMERESTDVCILCKLNLNNIDYTDVKILAQFIKRDGSITTYPESNLCSKQYRKVVSLIMKAQRCNLIARPPDYLVPGAWHDLNTYLEPDRKRDQPMKYVKKEYWKI